MCSPSCCSSLLFVGGSECFGVLAPSPSFALASFRGSDIVLCPRRKNYEFRLATPLDSRGYTRRSPRRRPACLDYVVDAHRIILEAHSSLYTLWQTLKKAPNTTFPVRNSNANCCTQTNLGLVQAPSLPLTPSHLTQVKKIRAPRVLLKHDHKNTSTTDDAFPVIRRLVANAQNTVFKLKNSQHFHNATRANTSTFSITPRK